ncbi:Uncharacterised protein [Legionella wadsworthii]|uniref:Antibiotic biosynthesis monooxygenase n=1 Tax=Legionella wadsworthii TaxID=28088 RepID=A0A378LTH9_9GAMM|nr:hypothetical protein [Legionella wadsworthii]STY29158.1 Uncharacterised protein [Legionella wadsworthii]
MFHTRTLQVATYIPMKSKENSALNIEEFFIKGAQLVCQTEPETALWFGLKENNQIAIFDVFFSEKGRDLHFAGQVAHALKENASNLILGGWEQGVLRNVNNYELIASSDYDKNTVLGAQVATFIAFQAKPGKNEELEFLLKEGAQLVNSTEPNTSFWIAMKTDIGTYAIFDTFRDKDAQKIHFSGKVANALQKSAEHLIEGGWEQGVVANVKNFQIIASS